MGLTPDGLLKKRIANNWEEYGDTPYDSDFIVGFAETEIPIYYNEIIDQWIELPEEYRDTWQDYGTSDNTKIYDLMSRDLFNYYTDRTSELLDLIRRQTNNA